MRTCQCARLDLDQTIKPRLRLSYGFCSNRLEDKREAGRSGDLPSLMAYASTICRGRVRCQCVRYAGGWPSRLPENRT
jgi:hypothetical protein